jgi:hypothetical protein
VEDEVVSLARESSASTPSNYDPPLRGIVDQNPVILEADVTAAEAARLQKIPCPKEKDDNPERRFVLLPKSDTYSPEGSDSEQRRPTKPTKTESAKKQEAPRKDTKAEPLKPRQDPPRREPDRPPIARQRSRQDLPSLQTKVPREIPPQFRRSASASASTPTAKEYDKTPKAPIPRTPSGEQFLTPDRPNLDYFSQSAPRHTLDSFGGRVNGAPVAEKRNNSSRAETPSTEKRNSANLEHKSRSRSNTNEKLSRPQQLSEEYMSRRSQRHPSPHSDKSGGRSSKSSLHSKQYYSSSEDDIADSDSEKHYGRRRHDYVKKHDDKSQRSPSRSNRSSSELKLNSKVASPLPSPKVSPSQIQRGDHFERSQTFPELRDGRRPSSRPASPLSADQETPRAGDRLNPLDPPRSKSRQSNAIPIPTPSKTHPPALPSHASLPIPIPSRVDLYSPGDARRTPSVPQFDDPRTSTAKLPAQQPAWQPPKFQPPSGDLQKPVGSYRRYSEDIERGSVAPLPSCPRTSFVRGKTDWLTLPQCPGFDMCPSCFATTIAPTEFRHLFIQAPPRPSNMEVLCDFGSSPWYRIAWLLTLKEKRKDLQLFYGLANICKKFQPCDGKREAIRQWHSIIDPKTGGLIRGFDVCPSCVKSVETLLPATRGIFIRKDHGPNGALRICDLRFDSKQFIQYFDALETTADRAEYDDDDPDTRDLASLIRRLSLFDECQHDKDLLDKKWHVITQLPEFTVCEECFDEVVWPELDERKAIPLMFSKDLKRIPKASCQLYSTKMRGIFRVATDADDYKLLASKARERKTIETAYKANLRELKMQGKGNPAVDREIKRVEDEWRKWE